MSDSAALDEKEFELMNAIAAGVPSSQRALSARTGFSLGLTNLVIRRLIKKGALKLRQLKSNRTEYFVTPEGAAQASKKAYSYTVRTISSLRLLRNVIRELVLERQMAGHRKIGFYGGGDLADLFDLAIKDPSLTARRHKFFRIQSAEDVKHYGVTFVFLCEPLERPEQRLALRPEQVALLAQELASRHYRSPRVANGNPSNA